MKILSTCYYRDFPAWTLPDWCVKELREEFPDFRIVKLTSPEGILDEARDADILFAWSVTEEIFRAAKKLKWIHTGMAGVGWILIKPVVESDVLVSNSRGIHAIPIAEHTMALVLALSRRLHDCLDSQRKGLWARTEIWGKVPSFEEVYGKTMGILGLGALGNEISRRARAFGMRVLGVRKNVAFGGDADTVYPVDRLNEILPKLDYLVIAAPLTPETQNLIGRAQFELMKPACFLINIARGEIVDQDVLIEMLENGRIAGAGLDVFTPDPLPSGHRLFFVKNVILTPHTSGVSPRLWRRALDIFIENIHRFLEGRELINRIDKKKGY